MEWDVADLDRIPEIIGGIMDHLLVCDGLVDPTIEFDSPTTVVFESIVEAGHDIDAFTRFSFLLRSCLHAAGVGTPVWQTADELASGYLASTKHVFTPEGAMKSELLAL